MPTERFFRLVGEKQEAIKRAAFDEFTRMPFDKASINHIIREAEISRGSFYTYFEDKHDLLHYILNDTLRQIRQFLEGEMEKNGGDLFDLFDKFFEKALNICGREDWFSFSHNVMNCISPEKALNEVRITGQVEGENLRIYLYKRADLRRLRLKKQEEFNLFMELVVASMMISMRKFYDGVPRERVLGDFRKKLELLKVGVCI